MSHRPHPRADRALNQLERHRSGTPAPTPVTVLLESPVMIQVARFVDSFERDARIAMRTIGEHMRNAGLVR